MKFLLKPLLKLHYFKKLNNEINIGRQVLNDKYHLEGVRKSELELAKTPTRTQIINFLLSNLEKETTYLEIGVRNPEDNFNLIKANIKYSVDPGFERAENLADFKLTSDMFFDKLSKGAVLNPDIRFDIIFIDGLHLAEQVEKDINHALKYLEEDGFLVLHDCNPPTEFHASETYAYRNSPAKDLWNGTTWKAFYDFRKRTDYYSCCIDTDWGVGIISKNCILGKPTTTKNKYYEYSFFNANRLDCLNLISFKEFKYLINK